jgi:hypothetical protein
MNIEVNLISCQLTAVIAERRLARLLSLVLYCIITYCMSVITVSVYVA